MDYAGKYLLIRPHHTFAYSDKYVEGIQNPNTTLKKFHTTKLKNGGDDSDPC